MLDFELGKWDFWVSLWWSPGTVYWAFWHYWFYRVVQLWSDFNFLEYFITLHGQNLKYNNIIVMLIIVNSTAIRFFFGVEINWFPSYRKYGPRYCILLTYELLISFSFLSKLIWAFLIHIYVCMYLCVFVCV